MIELTVPLKHIPVFGKEGTTLGLGPVVQHTGELVGEITIEYLRFEGDRIENVF